MPINLTRIKARERPLWFALTLLIFAALIWLRFSQLGTNPGWYSDEGSNMDQARNLAAGHWQYYALGGTPLLAGRAPLFYFFLNLGFQVWGYDILAARLVVAVFGIATALLLFIAVREMLGKWTALLSVLMLGIMPDTLPYSRIAFDYNAQAFFVVLCWYALWKFYVARTRIWLALAACAAAAAYMTALTGLPLIVCVVVIAILVRPPDVLWALPLMLAPALLYLAFLYFDSPVALQQDLALTFGRTGESLWGQFFSWLTSYVFWFNWSFWIAVGFIGFFLISNRALRYLTLFIFLSITFNIMRAFPGVGDISFHRYLGMLPLLAVGVAQFLRSAFSFLQTLLKADLQTLPKSKWLDWSSRQPWQTLLVYVLLSLFLIVPVLWLAMLEVSLVSTPSPRLQTRLDPFIVTKPSDARQITDWVNARTDAGDVVLASPTITWLLDSKVADFQQALAYEGMPTDNFGNEFPRTRFLYDVSFRNAKYVIVDRLWRGWASQRMPALKDYMEIVESWPRVTSQGEFDVYQNPAR